MRKLTFLFLACLLAGSLQAQEGISIGVNVTPMSTWMLNGDDFDAGAELNFRSTFGFSAGLNLGYNFTDRVGIVSGVLYSSEGQNYITDFDGRTEEEQDRFSRELAYIRVPLLFKYNSDITDRTSFLLRVGPYFGFLSSSQVTYEMNAPMAMDEESYDTQDLSYQDPSNPLSTQTGSIFNGFDLGLALELGSQVNLSESMQLYFLFRLAGSAGSIENSKVIQDLKTNNALNPLAEYPAANFFPADNNIERRPAHHVNAGIVIGFNYILVP